MIISRRGLFDFAHGGTGIFLALIPACKEEGLKYILYHRNYNALYLDAAMMFATELLKNKSGDSTEARNVVMLLASLVGYVPVLLALYNIYTIRYHKSNGA